MVFHSAFVSYLCLAAALTGALLFTIDLQRTGEGDQSTTRKNSDENLKPQYSNQELNLASTKITESGIEAICTMKSLRKLNVSFTEITPRQISRLVESLHNLKQIKAFQCCNLSENDLAGIISRHPGLILYTPFVDKDEIRNLIFEKQLLQAQVCAASAHLKLARQAHPRRRDLAEIEFLQGDIEQSIERFKQAESFYKNGINRLKTDNADIELKEQLASHLATVLETQHDWAAAIETRSQLEELHAKPIGGLAQGQYKTLSTNNLRHLAMDYAQLEKHEEERRYTIKCIDASRRYHLEDAPEYTDSLIAIGDGDLRKGNWKGAILNYEKVLAAYRSNPNLPRNPAVKLGLGLCFFNLKQWSKSEQALRSYIGDHPVHESIALEHLAKALKHQNKSAEANPRINCR